uniref:Uncharacterized protein n=1 Tax=viral metagenome TaxID=1070528 RepID=A0A6C0JT35_9ZZZZ
MDSNYKNALEKIKRFESLEIKELDLNNFEVYIPNVKSSYIDWKKTGCTVEEIVKMFYNMNLQIGEDPSLYLLRQGFWTLGRKEEEEIAHYLLLLKIETDFDKQIKILAFKGLTDGIQNSKFWEDVYFLLHFWKLRIKDKPFDFSFFIYLQTNSDIYSLLLKDKHFLRFLYWLVLNDKEGCKEYFKRNNYIYVDKTFEYILNGVPIEKFKFIMSRRLQRNV